MTVIYRGVLRNNGTVVIATQRVLKLNYDSGILGKIAVAIANGECESYDNVQYTRKCKRAIVEAIEEY